MHLACDRTLAAFALALSLVGCADAAQQDHEDLTETSQDIISAPSIPENLVVPDGNRLAFWLQAHGVQMYSCKANNGTYAWGFDGPDADLFLPFGKILVGHHYAGPTWELKDGSSVVGSKLAAATVDTTAIPWLLLKAASHSGQGLMSKVTYIQRLYTVGGLAPADGCDANHVGASANVDYSAIYAFYY